MVAGQRFFPLLFNPLPQGRPFSDPTFTILLINSTGNVKTLTDLSPMLYNRYQCASKYPI
jgi:hypothetical protein